MPATAPRARDRRTACRRGFNLIEVMVSMGIFVIAFVAVASIFPVAITLQREAVQKVEDDAAIGSAEATLIAFGIDVGSLDSLSTVYTNNLAAGGGASDGTVQPMLDDLTPPAAGGDPLPFFALQSRTLGVNPFLPDDPVSRPYVWVPLVQPLKDLANLTSTDPADFRVMIAVLRRNELNTDQRYFNGPRVYAGIDGWASQDDEQAPTLVTTALAELEKVPGLQRLQVAAVVPAPGGVNETSFEIGGPNGNEDGFGNRLIMPFDTFMDDNGFIYTAIASTGNSVTVAGTVVAENPVTNKRIDNNPNGFLWFAPRPLEDGSNSRRPENAPSPLIAIVDVSDVLK